MSKIRLMLAMLACAFTAAAAPEIQFLPYFDSLNSYRGQPGHWFVRDAAGSRTGMHGDPTVRKGWAIYTWNGRRPDGTAGWTKICEEESLDASTAEVLINEYVKKQDFTAATNKIWATFTLKTEYQADITRIKGVCANLKTMVQNLNSEVAATKVDVTKLKTVVGNLSKTVETNMTWSKAMSNNVLKAAMKYTDEHSGQGGVSKQYVDDATNNVLVAAKAYTDTKIGRTDIKIYDSQLYFGTDNMRTNMTIAGHALVDAVQGDFDDHRLSVLKFGKFNYFVTDIIKQGSGTDYGFYCTGFNINGFDLDNPGYPSEEHLAVIYSTTNNMTRSYYGNDAAEFTRTLSLAKLYTDEEISTLRGYVDNQDEAVSNNLDAVALGYATSKANAAKTEAISSAATYTDQQIELLRPEISTEINASNEVVLANAKTYADQTADAKDAVVSNNLDAIAQNYANAAQANAKSYTDGVKTTLSGQITEGDTATLGAAKADATTKANSAESNAKTYTDGKVTALNEKDAELDGKITATSNGLVTAIGVAKEEAITTAATDATTKANTAESNAKADTQTKITTAITPIQADIDSLDTRVGTIEGKMGGVYHFKGTVATTNDLPSVGQEEGDVWYVTAEKASYAWSSTKKEWYSLGGGMDLSAYKVWSETKTYVDEKAEAAESAAKSHAETKATAAETAAKAYTDDEVATTLASAKTYADGKTSAAETAAKNHSDANDTVTLNSAKSYTDTETVKQYNNSVTYTDVKVGPYKNDGRQVTIGGGASNMTDAASITICSYTNYPSFVYGAFNICLGIDNIVGDYEGTVVGESDPYQAKYAVAVGTSARASKMHSYAWGSQINALAANSTVMGYGLTATDEYSTVVGQASRVIQDRYFETAEAMTNFLKNAACKEEIFEGYGILVGNGPGCSHIVDAVLPTADPNTGMFATLRSGPYDIEVGYRRWYYGKSHGRGTFNIAAIGDGKKDFGFAKVYINDKNLVEWTGIHCGEYSTKYTYDKGIWGTTPNLCTNDCTVEIGMNAHATETYAANQAIAIGRDALSAGSATVAVGPNSFAIGALAAAYGWRANAIGDHSIAIGAAKMSGQNYYKDGAINPDSDLCQAVGSDSIAMGYNAKAQNNRSTAIGYYAAAKADNAVQIGYGTNTTANSLKFMNVELVKDGKVCGTFDPSSLDPKEIDISSQVTSEEITIQANAHIVNSLTSSVNCGPGTEMAIEPKQSRNYEIFIPNTEEFRAGLPITIMSEITDVKTSYPNGKYVYQLPVMFKCQQPSRKSVVLSFTQLDEGDDWAPVITNCNIKLDITAGKFVTDGNYSLEGTSLHAGTKYQIEYPISATATTTNDLQTLSASQEFMSSTFYGNVGKVDLVPSPAVHFTSDTSWFKIHYTTVNGKANVIQKTITIE